MWETRHRIGRPTQRIESWDRGKTAAGRLVERDWEIVTQKQRYREVGEGKEV